MRADLHTHSTASDGTSSPAAVIADAARAGLDVVALTDHDTTAGWSEASVAAGEAGIRLIPGTEISTRQGPARVHLLSYLHDPDDAALAAVLERSRTSRERRAKEMVRLIGRDYPLTWQDVLDHTPDGATVGRPHLADALVAQGVAASRDAIFADILRDRGPYDVPYDAPTPIEAVRLVRAAGGVPVIAHPRARTGQLSEDAIAELAEAGLFGLEADHRDHSQADRERLRGLAVELGLVVTGSSDYHGWGKPNVLGENLTAPVVVEQILEAAGRP